MDKKKFLTLLFIITAVLYFLAGVAINPMIIWVAGPIFISYPLFIFGKNNKSQKKCYGAYAYLAGSASFSLWYHLAWYTDLDGTKTGGSTSALIFAVFPIYAVIIGFLLWVIGYAIGTDSNENS